MNGMTVLALVKDLCRQLDEGRKTFDIRKACLAMTIPAVTFLPSCVLYAAPAYGAPPFDETETSCVDGIDNDRDGLVDCADPDCHGVEVCLGCFDGLDNDGNGLADCSDPTCAVGEGCQGLCDDGIDNDGDGLIDCDDPSCAGFPPCP